MPTVDPKKKKAGGPPTARFGTAGIAPNDSPAAAPSAFDIASGPGIVNPARDIAPEGGNLLSALERTPELTELLDLPAFSDVCRSFVDLYHIGLKVFDVHGNKLTDFPVGNADFCGYVFTFQQGQRGCTGTVARVKGGPIEPSQGARLPLLPSEGPKGTVTMPCFTGLRYLMMPLNHEGDRLGRVVFGPWYPDDLVELPEALTALGPGFDKARAKSYLSTIRKANEGTVQKVLGQFAKVLEALIGSGQKAYLTAQVHLEATRESYRQLETKNEQLTNSNERLKDLDRLKSAFLATVSHELRTPLTSIIGYSEMLSEGLAGPISPEQKEYVDIIMEKGETLLALISGILDLTQIEAGKVRLQFEPTDVSEVIRTSLSSVAPQFQKKGVKLVSHLAPMPKNPSLDREKVRQILVNLLSNSLKFTPEGGEVSVRLVPEFRYEGVDALQLIVNDTGVGIPQEHQSRVFESFYQVDNSSTREYGGAGLGLAIVKSFASAHGGKIELTSREGVGSTFTVVLPYTPRVAPVLRTPFG